MVPAINAEPKGCRVAEGFGCETTIEGFVVTYRPAFGGPNFFINS